MNDIIFSVDKKDIPLIFSGKKTALIAKKKPKEISFPIRVLIYEKRGRLRNLQHIAYTAYEYDGLGMIVGECICNAVNCITLENVDKSLEKSLKMNLRELSGYLNGEVGYIFFFSDVKKYKKPLALSLFGRNTAPSTWCRAKLAKE